MPPDIEWQVTDRAAPETIVKTTSGPPRWRRGIIIVVILIIGVGLLVAYTVRPATPAAPVTPTPTDTPQLPLKTVIDRETRVMAGGDMQTFLEQPSPAPPAG